ncbi:MAG: glycerol-3-phosphate dehydrogenase, partial [Pseudomonadota bacterium]|nr:glycerol-3-phosphate dehydrogenase [Pseudomonadota bacterium]
MKREGSLGAPTRHPLNWENPDFLDKESLDKEMERQFDVCHGCRRCFNLCGSFPKLFDLIDDSKTGELDSVSTDDYAAVVDDCTLCDMC